MGVGANSTGAPTSCRFRGTGVAGPPFVPNFLEKNVLKGKKLNIVIIIFKSTDTTFTLFVGYSVTWNNTVIMRKITKHAFATGIFIE